MHQKLFSLSRFFAAQISRRQDFECEDGDFCESAALKEPRRYSLHPVTLKGQIFKLALNNKLCCSVLWHSYHKKENLERVAMALLILKDD